ncbi:MAG: rhodanese-like domain-containing protein [Paracoccaceae bacterium]|nr:rhodanese-like domain-containing protein [Paracoccaceae bacterium]
MMQRRTLITIGAAALAAMAGAAWLTRPVAAGNLTLEALTGAQLASDPNTLLVDIRRPEEWKQTGVIEGALLVTYGSAEDFLRTVTPKLASGQRLALICRSGNRTSRATQQIAGLVDVPVVDVQGGMLRVLKEGYRPVMPTREMGCQSC